MKKRIISASIVLVTFCLIFGVTFEIKENPDNPLFAGVISLASVNYNNPESQISDADTTKVASGYAADGSFCGYKNLGICNISEGNLNVRETPEELGHIVGKLPKDAGCEVLGLDGDFIKIKSGKVEGYVSKDYLITGEAAFKAGEKLADLVATADSGGINIRQEANTDCTVLDQMAGGEELPVISVQGDWVKVDFDGEEAYVSADYVTVAYQLGHAMTIEEVRFGTGVSEARAKLCANATACVGNPYVWGGTNLTKGADCSGFVLTLYKQFGISLPHSSRAQANCGKRISASAAKPGDLFFYSKGGRIDHVAIYIGGGQICHASNRREGIKISSAYYRTPTCVVSIFD